MSWHHWWLVVCLVRKTSRHRGDCRGQEGRTVAGEASLQPQFYLSHHCFWFLEMASHQTWEFPIYKHLNNRQYRFNADISDTLKMHSICYITLGVRSSLHDRQDVLLQSHSEPSRSYQPLDKEAQHDGLKWQAHVNLGVILQMSKWSRSPFSQIKNILKKFKWTWLTVICRWTQKIS